MIEHPDDCVDPCARRFEAALQIVFILLPAIGLAFLVHQGIVHLWRMCWSGFC